MSFEFSIDGPEFAAAIERACMANPKVVGVFLVQGAIWLTGRDEWALTTWVPCNYAGEPQRFVVAGKFLAGVVRVFAATGEARVQVDDSAVIVRSGRSHARVDLVGMEDWPGNPLRPLPDGELIDFGSTLAAVGWALGDPLDVGLGTLRGVNLDGEWASSSDRIVAARIAFPCPAFRETPVSLPPKFVPVALGPMRFSVGPERDANREPCAAYVGGENWVARIPLYGGKLYNLAFVFQDRPAHCTVTVERRILVEAAGAARLLVGKDAGLEGSTPRITFIVGSEVLTLRSGRADSQAGGEMVLASPQVEIAGQATTFSSVPGTLERALRGIPGKTVTLEFRPEKIAPMRIVSDNGYTAIIAPVV